MTVYTSIMESNATWNVKPAILRPVSNRRAALEGSIAARFLAHHSAALSRATL
jgi:hypothetical protein